MNFQEKIIKQQLEKLKTQKNVIIDVDENLAIEYLKEHNYSKLFTSNKELFVTPKYKNDYYLITKNKRILREFKQGLRCEIKIKDEIEMEDVLNCLKNQETDKHQYLESVNFSDLMTLNDKQDELSLQQIPKLHKIEDILKSTITNFMLSYVIGDWKYWFLDIMNKKKPNTKNRILRMLNKLFDIITKNNGKNKSPNRWRQLNISTQHVVNEMSLGDLKECVDFILYSTLETDSKDELFNSLIKQNIFNFPNPKDVSYDLLLNNLGFMNRFRNSTMHFEKLSTFLLKERLGIINSLNLNDHSRIWFVSNSNINKTINQFIKTYNKLSKFNYCENFKDFTFNDLKIGYFSEIENIKTGKVKLIDLKIFKLLDLFLK